MPIIVGLIIFVLGIFVGGLLELLALLAYVEAQKHLMASGSAAQRQADTSPRPVALIPITLDESRIVEVGMSQALREAAARVARLN
jgi:hypothetical protein